MQRDPNARGDVTAVAVATPPDHGSLLTILVLLAAAVFTSGSFLLHPTDLHLPACSEPWDAAIYPWNFFWAKAWPAAPDGDLLFTRRFFHPAGEGLGLYTPTWCYGLLSLPFQWFSSAPEARHVAVAALLLLSSVATALLALRLVRELELKPPGALLAALLVTVASGRLMNGARLNLFCTEFLLLYAWLGFRWFRMGGVGRALGWGVAAAALLLQSQPLFFQAGVATALVLVGLAVRKAPRQLLRRRLREAAVATAAFLLLAGPFLYAMARELRASPALAQSRALIEAGSLDAAALVVPNRQDRFAALYAPLVQPLDQPLAQWRAAHAADPAAPSTWESKFGANAWEPVDAVGDAPRLRRASFYEAGGPTGTWSHFLGLGWILLLATAVVSATRRRAVAPLLFAAGALLVAVGPTLRFLVWTVPLPTLHQLLAWFPPLLLEKSPERLVFLVQLGLALAAGVGVDALALRADGRRRTAGTAVALLLALLTLVEQGDALPLRSVEPRVTVPAAVAALRHEPGDFTVLDLPYDGRPPAGHLAHRVNALAMAFGAAHERPIFFGLYPRATRRGEAALAARPLFVEIHRIEQAAAAGTLPPPPAAEALAAARRDLAELEIGALLLHDLADAPAALRREVELLRGFLDQLGFAQRERTEPAIGYTLDLYRF